MCEGRKWDQSDDWGQLGRNQGITRRPIMDKDRKGQYISGLRVPPNGWHIGSDCDSCEIKAEKDYGRVVDGLQ